LERQKSALQQQLKSHTQEKERKMSEQRQATKKLNSFRNNIATVSTTKMTKRERDTAREAVQRITSDIADIEQNIKDLERQQDELEKEKKKLDIDALILDKESDDFDKEVKLLAQPLYTWLHNSANGDGRRIQLEKY